MKPKSLLQGTLFSLSFLVLCSFFRDFVLDDSYIIYRFSQHLIQGHGLVWNLSEAPVEGYTSFSWVVLNALALGIGVDPVIFSKLFSVLCALGVIWLLVFEARDLEWGLAAVFVSAIALSPLFALLAMQGLETALAAWLLLLAARLTLKLQENPSTRRLHFWFIAMLVGLLTRPDAAPLLAGFVLGFFVILLRENKRRRLRRVVLTGAIYAAIGLLYMLWRIKYFGLLFPNPFYIKLGREAVVLNYGPRYLLTFLVYVGSPYLVLVAALLWTKRDPERAVAVAPLLLGIFGFSLYLLAVVPIQGYAWRYLFPAGPVFLLAAIRYFSGLEAAPGKWYGRAVFPVIALLLAGWTLRLLPAAREMALARNQHDRVIAGKRLAGIPGTMFTSESGALTYFSGWRSADSLGLTSTAIARHGLPRGFLEKFNPDLVMLRVVGAYQANHPGEKIIHQYLTEEPFIAVAALQKRGDQYHVYFVRRDSRFYADIVTALTRIPDLTYGDLEEIMAGQNVPVYEERDWTTEP